MRLTRRAVFTFIGVFVFLSVLFVTSGPVFATSFYSTNTSTSTGNSIGNAIKLSKKAYPGGASAAVVANHENWTQSVGASVLAGAHDGPLLLSSPWTLTGGVDTELRRLKPGVIFAVGLTSSAADKIRSATAGMNPRPQVVSLSGNNAYETAVLVARQVKAKVGTIEKVVIVPSDYSGGVLAASAMAAANGWPLLMTPMAGPFPQVSSNAIKELGATSGICVGTEAAPSLSGFSVEKAITGSVSSSDPDGRFSLCTRTGEYAVAMGYSSYDWLGLTEAYERPGGMVVSAYVAREGGLLALTPSGGLPNETKAFMRQHGREISEVSIVGLWWSRVREVKSLNAARVKSVSPNSGPATGKTTVVVEGAGFYSVDSVIVGKTEVPASDWKVDSSNQLTILATPEVEGSGPAEIIVENYWNRSPATVSDLYWYKDGSPRLPGQKVVDEAVKYLGVPYLWAGESPSVGFDCSGLAMYVYRKMGISLPHYSRSQAGYGTAVSKNDLMPGDLVFFYNPIGHVGIYVGNGLMINAPRSGDLVTIEDVYRSSYNTARRLVSIPTSYQQSDSRIAYVGEWRNAFGFYWTNVNRSGVTISFWGSSIELAGPKGPGFGKAEVSIDGRTPTTVDFSASSYNSRTRVFTESGLGDGEHTLTMTCVTPGRAIALDFVKVMKSDGTPGSLIQAPRLGRHQENDDRLVYTGTWRDQWTWWLASQKAYKWVNTPGASLTVSFDGTYIAWVGTKSSNSGKALVSLDGGKGVEVDLYSPFTRYKQKIYDTGLLPDGEHTLSIYWLGAKSSRSSDCLISIDAFDVLGKLVKADTAKPITWSYDQSDPRISYIGQWNRKWDWRTSAWSFAWVKGSNSTAEIEFSGQSFELKAKKGPCYGLAQVTLLNKDHEVIETKVVDLYASSDVFRQTIFARTLPSYGTYTIVVKALGKKNPKALMGLINIDGLELKGHLAKAPKTDPTPADLGDSWAGEGTTTTEAPTTTDAPTTDGEPSETFVLTRYEENASGIAYAGTLAPNSWGVPASAGRSVVTNPPGSSVTVSFDGTGIGWVTKKSPYYGHAKVFLDGAEPVTVDLYNPTEVWQQEVWNSGALDPGRHTVTIQWGYGRNAKALDNYLSIDAFDVTGTLVQAQPSVKSPDPNTEVVVIDPGHQATANYDLEPIGPGSSTMKAKVSAGTSSVNTGSPESELNLVLGLKLRDVLKARGIGS